VVPDVHPDDHRFAPGALDLDELAIDHMLSDLSPGADYLAKGRRVAFYSVHLHALFIVMLQHGAA